MNKWMRAISAEGKNDFSVGYHQTSSECTEENRVYCFISADGIIWGNTYKVVNKHQVHPVLAF